MGGFYESPGHDFAHYKKERMAWLMQTLDAAREDLTQLDRRIRQWVYAPEKLNVRDGPKSAYVVHLAMATPRFAHKAVCSPRLRHPRVTTDPAMVTCERCKK